MSPQTSQGGSLQEATDHFKRIPWCAAILEAPGVVSFLPTCRLDEIGNTSQDQLFRATLNTGDAVPFMVGFYVDPEAAQEDRDLPLLQAVTLTAAKTTASKPNEYEPTSDTPPHTLLIPSISLLCDLRAGVNGFNGTVQGGFLAAILDEAMGHLLFCNFAYQRQQEQQRGHGWTVPPGVLSLGRNARLFTASMALRFQRPLVTPCVVVATAALQRIDGRKLYLDVTVRDRDGAEYVRCEGMWMAVREGVKM